MSSFSISNSGIFTGRRDFSRRPSSNLKHRHGSTPNRLLLISGWERSIRRDAGTQKRRSNPITRRSGGWARPIQGSKRLSGVSGSWNHADERVRPSKAIPSTPSIRDPSRTVTEFQAVLDHPGMAGPGSIEQEGTTTQVPQAIVSGGQESYGNDHSFSCRGEGCKTI
jgi:hypothetical protein